MKKYGWIVVFLLGMSVSASAQKLVIGQRAPDLRVGQYLSGGPVLEDVPLWIEFFYSAGKPSLDRLPALDELARRYEGRLQVVALSREAADQVEPLIRGKEYAFAVGLDEEGKTFQSFGVEYVPFSVLLDAKGKVCWYGNPVRLDQKTIDAVLK